MAVCDWLKQDAFYNFQMSVRQRSFNMIIVLNKLTKTDTWCVLCYVHVAFCYAQCQLKYEVPKKIRDNWKTWQKIWCIVLTSLCSGVESSVRHLPIDFVHHQDTMDHFKSHDMIVYNCTSREHKQDILECKTSSAQIQSWKKTGRPLQWTHGHLLPLP